MKDTDLMPWGKYKGHEMQNVPANYLIYMYQNNKCSGKVKQYIIDSWDFLQKENRTNDSL